MRKFIRWGCWRKSRRPTTHHYFLHIRHYPCRRTMIEIPLRRKCKWIISMLYIMLTTLRSPKSRHMVQDSFWDGFWIDSRSKHLTVRSTLRTKPLSDSCLFRLVLPHCEINYLKQMRVPTKSELWNPAPAGVILNPLHIVGGLYVLPCRWRVLNTVSHNSRLIHFPWERV